MSHVIFSCDFLSWLYEQTPSDALPAIEPDVQNNYRQVKLDKAAGVLQYRLLRVFAVEHPYMRRKSATPAEAKRLRRYEAMFGYRPGSWFLDALISALQEYADKRGLSEAALERARIATTDATRRLTAAYNHPALRS